MAYNLLKGKRGIVFGALNEQSIAWKVAERAVEEGAQILLTNTPVAMRIGATQKLAEQCGTIVVPADATSVEDLQNLVARSILCFTRWECRRMCAKTSLIRHSITITS